MNTSSQVQGAQLDNRAFALMGRLHVILRRESGRVTDIEYMRIDPGYCHYVLDMAAQLPNEDLREICEKLEDIYFGSDGLFVRTPPAQPLLARRPAPAAPKSFQFTNPAQPKITPATEPAAAREPGSDASVDHTYIGRLR